MHRFRPSLRGTSPLKTYLYKQLEKIKLQPEIKDNVLKCPVDLFLYFYFLLSILKPGVGQYVHATLTARDFFLAYFYIFVSFTCIFPNLPRFCLLLAVANTGSCVGQQNIIGHCWMQVPV